LAPVVSLVSIHHLRPRAGLIGPASVLSDSVGYHVYLQHGTSVCWHNKTWLKSGPVTADLTTTVVHKSTLLINDVKPDHSLYFLRLFSVIQIQIVSFFNMFTFAKTDHTIIAVTCNYGVNKYKLTFFHYFGTKKRKICFYNFPACPCYTMCCNKAHPFYCYHHITPLSQEESIK